MMQFKRNCRLGALLAISGLVFACSSTTIQNRSAEFNNSNNLVSDGATIKHNKGPDVPNEYMYLQRAEKNGRLNTAARPEAIKSLRAQRSARISAGFAANDPQWQLMGPTNIGGRVTDVVGDASNSNKFYFGTANGGVFKTTDGGTVFTPIFDQAGSLSIGALALDPRNSDVIYVGTGEANPGGGSVSAPGDGLWKSSDGGATWRLIGLDKSVNIGTIAIDKNQPDTLFVAVPGNLFDQTTERGVYRSKDAGVTWQLVHSLGTTAGAIDVMIDPSNSNRIYAVMWERYRTLNTRLYGGEKSGLWRSLDGGNTWAAMTSGLPLASTKPGRIALAQSTSSPATMYSLYSDAAGNDTGLYRSTDFGSNWSKLSATGMSGVCGGYCWWFGNISINPTNANDLFIDGVGFIHSTNGGSSFSSVGGLHADQHAQWWSPSTAGFVLKGNDGGLYKSTNSGVSWTKFPNLPISQFYAIESHPTNQSLLSGGLQDNGTVRGSTANAWTSIYGGDGFTTLTDPTNANYVYAESQWGAMGRSTNGGSSFSSGTSGITGRNPWHAAYVFDPSNPAIMYFGTHMLHRSDNRAVSWTAVTSDLSNGDQGSGGVVYGTISSIAVAPSNGNEVYVGTDDGNVYRVTRSGTTHTKKLLSGLPKRWVTAIAVDPLQAGTVYVAFSGFAVNDSSAFIYRSTDYGLTWTAIASGLPNAPINDIVIDKATPTTLYLANDVGVYISKNSGATWAPFGTGLPEVVVSSLKYSKVNGVTKLFAGTYGRSIYGVTIDSVPTTEIVLTNCTAKTIATVAKDQWAYFKLPVTSSFAKLSTTTTTSSGDADLFVRKLAPPSTSVYDCKSDGATGTESCVITPPVIGDYYISVFAYSALSNLNVKACAQ